MVTHPRPALRWLRSLSRRPHLVTLVDSAAIRADVAAIAAEVRPLLAADDSADVESPAPFTGRPVVPPMPDWAPGNPFGMVRHPAGRVPELDVELDPGCRCAVLNNPPCTWCENGGGDE